MESGLLLRSRQWLFSGGDRGFDGFAIAPVHHKGVAKK